MHVPSPHGIKKFLDKRKSLPSLSLGTKDFFRGTTQVAYQNRPAQTEGQSSSTDGNVPVNGETYSTNVSVSN